MSGLEIIEKMSMNLAAVKSELEKIKKRDGELDMRGNKTEEYVLGFCKLSKKDAEELQSKLETLNIPRFKDNHINKIIDMMPESVAHLKILLQGFSLTMSQESLKKIDGILAGYRKKK